MNEIFITANELSKITGKTLSQVIEAIKCARIKATVSQNNGMTIPLSSLWVYIE